MTQVHQGYDPAAPLPATGTFVVQASAGTGKTYAITKLVARFVAETEVSLDQVLVMTFTRSAAGELRERIRTELRSQLTQSGQPARERLERAISRMDDATIGTTHAFCTAAFARLGVRADSDPGAQLSDDLTDIVLDATTDAYLADPASHLRADLDGPAALGIGRLAAAHPGIPLVHDTAADARTGFAERVRAAVAHEQRRLGAVSYDDLVLRLRDALGHPTNGPRVAQMLRAQFRVVLIDEFQDTDPAQWEIVRRAFHGHAIVFLIGDPKQGIYAFRGADINSYLDAAAQAGSIRTLGTNHRSDAAVVAGVQELLQVNGMGIELGDPAIAVEPVTARKARAHLTGGMLDPIRRVRLRVIADHDHAATEVTRRAAARDTAADILRLLQSRPTLETPSGGRDLRPGDIAVIVPTNRNAAMVRDALADAGLHAVINSTDSVFSSRAAEAMLRLLQAMERPRGSALRAAVLAGLFEPDPAEFADDEQAALAVASARVAELSTVVHESGIPALMAAVTSDRTLLQRSLRRGDGERFLTDLRHIGEILHAESRARHRGLTDLAEWLAAEIGDASADTQERVEERTRRLDSDSDAVQVVTVHRCKGLQYPVTYVPYAWDRSMAPGKDHGVLFHAGAQGRMLDVRDRDSEGRQRSEAAAAVERAGEQLRMLYVALTRAASLLVITCVDTVGAKDRAAPLDRILFARSHGATEPQLSYSGHLPVGEFDHIVVERLDIQDVRGPWAGGRARKPPARLAAARYDRTDIDTAWARASFTALTREGQRRPGGLDDTGLAEKDDEPIAAPPAERFGPEPAPEWAPGNAARPAWAARLDDPSPMAGLPAGRAFGTLVHAVLETVDMSTPNLDAEVRRCCEEQMSRRPVPGTTAAELAAPLVQVVRTPLGSLAPGWSLAQVRPANRLAELDFELPMHRRASGAARTVAAIGALLADSTEPQWVRAYGEDLRRAAFGWRQLRGYLTGSIDAVLRVDGRFVVVDYKTNRLGHTLGHYRPAALPAAMAEAHYPLQALLYSVALHRFLRLRQAEYDPRTHLGGILYAFVRGMTGPSTPVDEDGNPCGVFAWLPAPALIERLSALLGGEQP